MSMSQLCYLAGAMALPLGLLLRLCTKSSVTPSSRPQRETVIITGGCSGLGLEIASIYLKANAQVAVLDVVDEAAPKLSEFPSMRYYKCDVSKEKQVKDTMDNIEDELGTPTILINCAAMSISNLPFHKLSPEAFAKTMNVNLLGAVNTIHAILPKLILGNTHLSIVNVSSVVAHLYPGGLSDYAASKAGLSALHHCLEAEARHYGQGKRIQFFLVEVGQMDTPLFSWIKPPNSLLAPVLTPQYVAEKIHKAVASGQGKPIRLPQYASWVGLYDVLPRWIQRNVRLLMGIDDALIRQNPETREKQRQ